MKHSSTSAHSFRVRRLLGLVAGLVAVCGCGGSSSNPPNLVVITIDTLRADHLGCYGYFRDTSPHLDALAAESLVFDECRAPVALTLPTHTSLFTGLYPREHGISANFDQIRGRFVHSPMVKPLAVVLKQAHINTAAFVSAEPLKREGGLADGFDVWEEPESREVSADRTVDRALEWLARSAEEPFFMWVHLFDPHAPYRAPAPYDTIFKYDEALAAWLGERGIVERDHLRARDLHNAYDGEVRYTDEQLGRLLTGLKAEGLWENTVILLTSDHGEALGQHDRSGHGYIWMEQLRVPLVVRVPGLESRRVATPLTSRDIMPTVMGLVPALSSQAFLSQCTGVDVLAPGQSVRPLYSQVPTSMKVMLEGVTLDGWRLISSPQDGDHLFDIRADPYELNDVASDHPETVSEMRALLADLVAEQTEVRERNQAGEVVPMSEEREAALRALGYGGDAKQED